MYGANYGQVVPWDKNQDHSWVTIGYPRAQLVLESQALTLKFVRKTVRRLLEGVELQSLFIRWDQIVQNEFRIAGDQDTRGMLSNRSFLWPPKIDEMHLLALCESRLSLAQDEL